jgi:hypothetical protein
MAMGKRKGRQGGLWIAASDLACSEEVPGAYRGGVSSLTGG